MKKGILATMVLFLALIFCVQPVMADTTTDLGTGGTASAYSVSIEFQANGGSGVMSALTVSSDLTANPLTKNVFVKTGFTFAGWNTLADGDGVSYTDMQDMTALATAENNGTTITLYAQWKLATPSIKKLKALTPADVKVTYKKDTTVSGYEIQYGQKKNFKKAITTEVSKKGSTNTILRDVTPGKTCYVRMRSYSATYVKRGKENVEVDRTYSDWSAVKKIKMKKGNAIINTKALTSGEAEIVLKGSGTGYHAKLVLVTPTSAVSFGIQYDQWAVAPYTGKAMALIENVAHNGPGGQTYTRPGNKELQVGKKYHMMITVDRKGNGSVYLDYKKIGSFSNAGLANTAVGVRVEGAVRLNGDSIDATFDNIKLRQAGKYEQGKKYGGYIPKSNAGIKTKKINDKNKVIVKGTGVGINGDWESDYENVSGIFQFY